MAHTVKCKVSRSGNRCSWYEGNAKVYKKDLLRKYKAKQLEDIKQQALRQAALRGLRTSKPQQPKPGRSCRTSKRRVVTCVARATKNNYIVCSYYCNGRRQTKAQLQRMGISSRVIENARQKTIALARRQGAAETIVPTQPKEKLPKHSKVQPVQPKKKTPAPSKGQEVVLPSLTKESKPIEFLKYLLAQSQQCQLPKEMTAEQRADPYKQFTYYREFYLTYALTKELPALNITNACYNKKAKIELEGTTSSVQLLLQSPHQVEVKFQPIDQPTIEQFYKTYVKAQKQNSDCRLFIVQMGIKVTDLLKRSFGHQMSLIVDSKTRVIEYMEPNGAESAWVQSVSEALQKFFQSGDTPLRAYRFEEPMNICPIGIQEGPYCAHYSLLYDWLRVACNGCDAKRINSDLSLFAPSQRKAIVNSFTCHMWNSVANAGLLKENNFSVVKKMERINKRTALMREYLTTQNSSVLEKVRQEEAKEKAMKKDAMNKIAKAKVPKLL